ncbi:hypothetical protein [Devosia sp.]|uniref:hypothetical protein n=1 Tax=Devosia sp. TaxID=1871048 RepID=UPI003F725A1A
MSSSGLEHVYWLGGGSGGGKSTIARGLAERFGMALYPTDDTMSLHADEARAEDAPFIAQFKQMTMDERWLLRSPQEMLHTFHWYNGEAFELILRDLRTYPTDRPVLVEGLRLLPRLVAPQLAHRHQGLWLLPTAEFRASAFTERGTLWQIPSRTSDPPSALRNLLERDDLFTQRLQRELDELNLPLLVSDGSRTTHDSVELVARMMRLG